MSTVSSPGLRGEVLCIYSTVSEHFGLSDHFLPALTCCHLENKTCIQGNGQTIGSTALVPIKRKGPERTGKAPTTPVKTHLGASKIPLKTLTSQHYKLLCFFTETWEPYFKLHRTNHNLLNNPKYFDWGWYQYKIWWRYIDQWLFFNMNTWHKQTFKKKRRTP